MPLRILHLRNSDRLGGPERLILEQARRAAPDVEVTLASFAREGAPHPFLDEARRLGLRALPVAQRGSYDVRVVGLVRAAIDLLLPHVVLGHDYKADLVLARAARGRAVARAALVHGYTGENRKVRAFEALDRRCLRSADAVVAVAASVRAALARAGVPADRIHAIENGIDVEAVAREAASARDAVRAEWGLSPDEPCVLSLGRLSPEKGQDVLLDAWLRLALPRGVLVLAGEGASRAGLERAAGAARAGSVRFAGWRTDPWRCLGAADVLVLPSRTEGLPLALLEAMAAGVPGVATRVGGMPDALDDGRCGRLVPPDDAAALAGALRAGLEPAGTRALVAAARSRVAERYPVERQVRALEALWRRLPRAPTTAGG